MSYFFSFFLSGKVKHKQLLCWR